VLRKIDVQENPALPGFRARDDSGLGAPTQFFGMQLQELSSFAKR
jgi:hypothetical protein